MRLSSHIIVIVTFVAAAILSLIAAGFSVDVIEDNSEIGVRNALDKNALTWAEVEADGLRVVMSGTAPSEAKRFKAISTAGSIVDAARIIDQMSIEATADIAPPRFSVEILRNDSGISLIGLVPVSTDRDDIVDRLTRMARGATISDLLQTADYPKPDGWDQALDYAIEALRSLPRSKISVDAQRVSITANTDGEDEKRKLETALANAIPDTLGLALNISAPRPVITPFTLRFIIEDGTAHFDSCSADNDFTRTRIITAATKAGLTGKAKCTIGLGVPSQYWAQSAELAIAALAEIGGGSVTFADADITLVAIEGTEQSDFDRTIGELETALPEVFTLHAVLPELPEHTDTSVPEFTATLSPEGLVQLRGRVGNELTRQAADSFSRARFGSRSVHTATRTDDSLPGTWPIRVLASLEALSRLSNGAVLVQPGSVSIRGNTGNTEARSEIAKILSEKLGEKGQYTIDVTYQEKLDPIASLPTPAECEAAIADILATRKISFEPGSDNLDEPAEETMDAIAEILKICGEIKMEIGGHTDSQGRESMNQALSQSRAQAVLNELRKRRVLTSTYSAKGYGESQPIADNGTEEGREANRRIEFKVIRPAPVKEKETTLESIEQPMSTDTAVSGVEQPDTPVEPEAVSEGNEQ